MIDEIRFEYHVYHNNIFKLKLQNIDASIEMNADADIVLNLRGNFVKNESIDLYNDLLKVVLYKNNVGYDFGTFIVATVEYSNDTMVLECYDKSYYLTQTLLTQNTFFARNSHYNAVIESLLLKVGIEDYTIENNAFILSSDREFEAQTSYLSIINMLLEEMNYQKLKYHLNGVAIMTPLLSNLERPIDFTFINTNFSVLDRDISITYDTFNVPNVFVGTVDNPDLDTTYYAKVINDDPTSKYSTTSIGREIPVFFTPENIVNQATLVHFLEHKKNQAIFKIQTVKIKIAITPNMVAGAKVFLKNDKIEGIFIVKKWSLELTYNGLMDLTLEREVHNV